MASLVDQIFEQAKLGTSVNPDANPVMQGVAAGQAQQHINLANRQLAMQLAMQPLQMEQQRQANDLQALNIQSSLLQRNLRTKGLEAFNQLQQDVHPDLTGGNIDDTLNKVVSYAGNHPVLWGTPEFVAMKDSLFKMKQEADMAKARLEVAGARGTAAQAAMIKADPASHYNQLAQEAEAAGETALAQQYHELSGLALAKEKRLDAMQADIHQRNQIRLQQLGASTLRPAERAALAVLQSKLRNIENAPRMKQEDRNAAATMLLDDFESKIGKTTTPAVGEPAAAAPPEPPPSANVDALPAHKQPAAAAAKVTIEKNGKRFLLPASQLPDALKQGYRRVD